MTNTSSEKILSHLKRLREHLHEGEKPLFSIPAIWENATEKESHACDLVLTNQRLFGYIYTSFPRERLFLDDLELDKIKVVSIREKNFEALFRELFVSDGQKKIYIRATRKKIENAYAAIRSAIAEYAPAAQQALDGDTQDKKPASQEDEQPKPRPAPIYGRQQVRQTLERSPLGITLLLVGGLLLEIVGAIAWATTGSLQTGLPLFLAGLVAVIVATLVRRQLR